MICIAVCRFAKTANKIELHFVLEKKVILYTLKIYTFLNIFLQNHNLAIKKNKKNTKQEETNIKTDTWNQSIKTKLYT